VSTETLLGFIILVSGAFISITVVGAIFFARWARREKRENLRAKETEIADLFKEGKSRSNPEP